MTSTVPAQAGFKVYGSLFKVDARYQFLNALGKGSYGIVCAAKDKETGQCVAIKKVSPMAKRTIDAKHTLREVLLLEYLGKHPNIVSVHNLSTNVKDDELYIVMDLMDTDLHRVIQSSQPLSDAHVKFFLHQLLRGVKYLHDNGVLHRDLKPGNLLLTKTCQLKIADFGLARKLPKSYSAFSNSSTGRSCSERPKSAPAISSSSTATRIERAPMTEHVVTRWYRAPELMLQPDGLYDRSVDMWSVGCIFAEILGRKALFPGKNFMHQLSLIFDVIGTPPPEAATRIKSAQAQKFLRSLGKRPKISFKSMFPAASDSAIDLLDHLLEFDPQKRISADEALAHPYLIDVEKKYKGGVDPHPSLRIDFSFDSKNLTKLDLRAMIIKEVDRIRKLQMSGAADEVALAEESASSPVISNSNAQKTMCGAAGSSLIRSAAIRVAPSHSDHSEHILASGPGAPSSDQIHSKGPSSQQPTTVVLGSRRSRIRTLSKPPVPRRQNSPTGVCSTSIQGSIRVASATATQQLLALSDPGEESLITKACNAIDSTKGEALDSPTVHDHSPTSPRSPEQTDNNHHDEGEMRAENLLDRPPPRSSEGDKLLSSSMSTTVNPGESAARKQTTLVESVVKSPPSTAQAIAAAIALGERSKALIASLATSRCASESANSICRHSASAARRTPNPAVSPSPNCQNKAMPSSSSSSEASPSVPDSPPPNSLEHFKGPAVSIAPTIPRRRIASAGPLRGRTSQVDPSRISAKDGACVGSTSSLIRAQRAGGGQTLTESANRTIAAIITVDHRRHQQDDNDDRVEHPSPPREETKTGLLKPQRSTSQLHGVENQHNGRKVPPKRLTVPRSPKFSVMSWQKKRDGVGGSSAPLAAAVTATGRR